MQFKIRDIGEEGLAIRVPVTEEWLKAEAPDLEARPAPTGLVLDGRIMPSGNDFLLRGKLRGALLTTCARCLEPAELKLDEEVTVCFVEKAPEVSKEEDDDLEGAHVITFEEGVIDLKSELREEVLLAIPPSPLCREDCRGLCPVCGGNRNTSPCDCEEKQRAAAGKFSVLSKLKIEQ